ncbi:hypothetical protein [Sphingobacterium sp. E70]|nr:hypothetical protein [Sphingobacterium sp. E70]
MMTNLFYYFTRDSASFKFTGAPFFLAALLMGISVVIVRIAFKSKGNCK